MRELRVIVTTADPERFRGVLVTAAAAAAMGGGARLLLQLDAVALLQAPVAGPQDEAHRAEGLPGLAEMIAEAVGLGVGISACQSGLALCGMVAEDLPEGVDVSGPVAFLQGTDDAARLMLV